VRGETRRALLRRFPYAIYFRLLDEEIVILGVVHGRRHPRIWERRR
jgi:plasmid stabilization system protein ParE